MEAISWTDHFLGPGVAGKRVGAYQMATSSYLKTSKEVSVWDEQMEPVYTDQMVFVKLIHHDSITIHHE